MITRKIWTYLSEKNINQVKKVNYQVYGVAGQSFFLVNDYFFFFYDRASNRKAVWCLAIS